MENPSPDPGSSVESDETTPPAVDYFNPEAKRERYMFPDDLQWIEFKSLNEGERRKYQHRTQQQMRVDKKTQETVFSVDPGVHRHELILTAAIDWHVYSRNQWMKFNRPNIEALLKSADPRVVSDMYEVAQTANPWLTEGQSVEDIDQMIEDLEDRREVLIEEEEGKEDS